MGFCGGNERAVGWKEEGIGDEKDSLSMTARKCESDCDLLYMEMTAMTCLVSFDPNKNRLFLALKPSGFAYLDM